MRIALCGATGRAGSRIGTELVARGHAVTAVVREVRGQEMRPGVTAVVSDLSDVAQIVEAVRGADALVSAYAPPADDLDALVRTTERLVEAVRQSGVPRLLVVGGAGTLWVAPGVTLLDSGYLLAEWRGIAEAHARMLEMLSAATIDWTYFAPAGYFDPGERTGRFRLGTDTLITDEKGESRISMEDYAIAMVDEIETPRHRRGRMCIGY